MTGIKFIYSLEYFSRIANSIVLAISGVFAVNAILNKPYSSTIWYWYLLPGILICTGLFINISFNVAGNFKLFGFYAMLTPWLIYLSIPRFMNYGRINSEKLFYSFYLVMFVGNLLGFLDYIFVLKGIYNGQLIETPYGDFISGIFSLFHMLEDGTPHFRYYSFFLEPGTLAMFLIPVICYSIYKKKILGLIIFIVALILTNSLGGFISLIILVTLIVYNSIKKSKLYILIYLIILGALSFIYYDKIYYEYESKGNSAEVREESFLKTIENIPVLIFTKPLGISLQGSTREFKKDDLYVGSNFMPGSYLQYGGVLAFVGYLLFLKLIVVCSYKKIFQDNKTTVYEKIIYTSIIAIIPFIFQRQTIWESSIFALIYSPIIISYLKIKKPNRCRRI